MAAYPRVTDTNNSIVLGTEALKRARIIANHCAKFIAFPIACDFAGVAMSTAQAWKQHSPEFQALMLEAELARKHKLESEAWRRALAGSDLLLMFMLKAADPTIYERNQRIELTGPGGAPLELSDPQRAARVAAILAAIVNKRHGAQGTEPVTIDAEYRDVSEPQDDCSDLFE